jgi:hypothetical protein
VSRRLSWLAAGLLLLAGCGLNSTTRSGEVGDTLEAGGLRASVVEVDPSVPRPEGRDYSGLGTPAKGMRFFGVDVKVCTDRGKAIGPYDFRLKLDGGDKARLRFPQSVYPDDFDSVRDGCARGWIVFEAPKDTRAEEVSFKYDDTGSAQASGDTEKHARFSWKV